MSSRVPLPKGGTNRNEKSFTARAGVAGHVLADAFRFLVRGRDRAFRANRVEAEAMAREAFAAMLRDPFPGESDAEIARRWSDVLGRSPRQVRNWLDGTHGASFADAVIVGGCLGIDRAEMLITGGRLRDDVLAQIGQGRG